MIDPNNIINDLQLKDFKFIANVLSSLGNSTCRKKIIEYADSLPIEKSGSIYWCLTSTSQKGKLEWSRRLEKELQIKPYHQKLIDTSSHIILNNNDVKNKYYIDLRIPSIDYSYYIIGIWDIETSTFNLLFLTKEQVISEENNAGTKISSGRRNFIRIDVNEFIEKYSTTIEDCKKIISKIDGLKAFL